MFYKGDALIIAFTRNRFVQTNAFILFLNMPIYDITFSNATFL